MKLARMLRLRASVSSGRPAEEHIRELFGESETQEGAVEIGRKLLRRREELLDEGKKVRNYHHYEYYRG